MSSSPQPNNQVEGGSTPKINLNAIKKNFRTAIERIEYEDEKGDFSNIILHNGSNTKVVFFKKAKDFPEINLQTVINDLNEIKGLFKRRLPSDHEEVEREIREQFSKDADDAKFTCSSIQMTSKNSDSLNQAQRYLSNLSSQLEQVCLDIDKLQENREKITNWFNFIQDD